MSEDSKIATVIAVSVVFLAWAVMIGCVAITRLNNETFSGCVSETKQVLECDRAVRGAR